ncbi:MAG: hypothetical protein PHI28_19555, partial [Mangrovibacterium sp.]|nr:hypothetical protein [Mangrovibacterium sp.]
TGKTSIDQIPILGWYGVSPKESAVDRFIEQRKSGITHNFTIFSSVKELTVAMDAAAKAGIKMIIHCPELATETYREHVQLFINDVPLELLSFDHYPIVLDPSGNRVVRGEWYDNLEVFSDEARRSEER